MVRMLALFATLLSLSGCLVRSPAPKIRVVTQVRISATKNGETIRRSCADQGSIGKVLNYLRTLDPYTRADIDADSFRTPQYDITLEYSDGNSTHYRQLHNSYLKTDGGPWKKIDPTLGSQLEAMLPRLGGFDSHTCNPSAADI